MVVICAQKDKHEQLIGVKSDRARNRDSCAFYGRVTGRLQHRTHSGRRWLGRGPGHKQASPHRGKRKRTRAGGGRRQRIRVGEDTQKVGNSDSGCGFTRHADGEECKTKYHHEVGLLCGSLIVVDHVGIWRPSRSHRGSSPRLRWVPSGSPRPPWRSPIRRAAWPSTSLRSWQRFPARHRRLVERG